MFLGPNRLDILVCRLLFFTLIVLNAPTVKSLDKPSKIVDGHLTKQSLQNFIDSSGASPINLFLQNQLRAAARTVLLKDYYDIYLMDPTARVGRLELKTIFEAIDRCQVFENSSETPLMAEKLRDTDIYIRDSNVGIFNREVLKYQKHLFAVVGIYLHVCFGSSGLDDKNYDLTTGLLAPQIFRQDINFDNATKINYLDILYFPSKVNFRLNEATPIDQEFMSSTTQGIPVYTKLAGGSYTGVGGGGDALSLLTKINLLRWAPHLATLKELPGKCKTIWADPLNFIDHVLQMQIESKSGLDSNYKVTNKGTVLHLRKLPLENIPPELLMDLSFILVHEICSHLE